MKLTMLGTGHAMVTACYNTCFILENNGELLLVDGGGGNTLLSRIAQAGYKPGDIHHIFVTHKHLDHITGIFWMLRLLLQGRNPRAEDTFIYAHDEVIAILRDMAEKLLQPIGGKVHLVELRDGEAFTAIGCRFTAFDIQSTKAKQFGFTMCYGEGKKLTCCGDEPYNECCRAYAEHSDWLLHEAFCLEAEADIYHPYQLHHSTAMHAARLAEELGVKNLLLYHTEDRHMENRKALYTAEGKQCFSGGLFVPEDLEAIEI